jgi:hypothetical protein
MHSYTDLKVVWAFAHPEGAAKLNYFDRYIPTEVFGQSPNHLVVGIATSRAGFY